MRSNLIRFTTRFLTYLANGVLAVVLLFETMIVTSLPLAPHQAETVERAVKILDQKGFDREAFVLRNISVKRSSDNWLNQIFERENAFAATNMPFGILTIYPDFYKRTKDDTERAMILLHEARHMLGSDEHTAYSYVWKNREKLGWTQMSHGSGEVYTTVEEQTRSNAPELFNCPDRLWSDCTEMKVR